MGRKTNAAATIQKCFRGNRDRADLKKQKDAATKIQRVFRQNSLRKKKEADSSKKASTKQDAISPREMAKIRHMYAAARIFHQHAKNQVVAKGSKLSSNWKHARAFQKAARYCGTVLRAFDDSLMEHHIKELEAQELEWATLLAGMNSKKLDAQSVVSKLHGRPIVVSGMQNTEALGGDACKTIKIYENGGYGVRVVGGEDAVLEAFYGDAKDPRKHGKDVTAEVKRILRTQNILEVSSSIFGDPCPGISKCLILCTSEGGELEAFSDDSSDSDSNGSSSSSSSSSGSSSDEDGGSSNLKLGEMYHAIANLNLDEIHSPNWVQRAVAQLRQGAVSGSGQGSGNHSEVPDTKASDAPAKCPTSVPDTKESDDPAMCPTFAAEGISDLEISKKSSMWSKVRQQAKQMKRSKTQASIGRDGRHGSSQQPVPKIIEGEVQGGLTTSIRSGTAVTTSLRGAPAPTTSLGRAYSCTYSAPTFKEPAASPRKEAISYGAPVGGGSEYIVGQKLEYFSTSIDRWVPCQVTDSRGDGSVQVNVKKNYWISVSNQAEVLRKPHAGADFKQGQAIEYYSESQKEWMPCTVEETRPDGAIQVSVKKGFWMDPNKVRDGAIKVRDPQGQTCDYVEGQDVEYRSPSLHKWIPCKVTEVRADGAIQVNVKHGVWFTTPEQKKKIRKGNEVKEIVVTNLPVQDGPSPVKAKRAPQVHVLVTWNDYGWSPLAEQGWGGPTRQGLDTDKGAACFKNLLQASGITTNVYELCRKEMTAQNVLAKIREVGSRCDVDDLFILYYTGHGDRLPDQDGDEPDGFDEAICTVSQGGLRCDQSTYLRDDDLAYALSHYVNAARLLMLMDCCHSGTVTDLGKAHWGANRKMAVSISGCEDQQESAGTGAGGLFTRAMCLASMKLIGTDCSVATFYNRVLQEAMSMKAQTGSKQNITLQCCPGTQPNQLDFPLVAKSKFQLPPPPGQGPPGMPVGQPGFPGQPVGMPMPGMVGQPVRMQGQPIGMPGMIGQPIGMPGMMIR